MALGYDEKRYILAFDHRGSFEKMFGISGRAPTDEETAKIRDAKRLIFEGFQRAVEAGAPRAACGSLEARPRRWASTSRYTWPARPQPSPNHWSDGGWSRPVQPAR